MVIVSDLQLGPDRWAMVGEERQVGVGGGAREHFEVTRGLMTGEGGEGILVELAPVRVGSSVEIFVETGESGELRLEEMALAFECGEFDAALQVRFKAVCEQFIAQHRTQGGGEGEGEMPWHGIVGPPLHPIQQGQVTLGQGFEEPILLVKRCLLRMANKWQVGM